MDRSVPLFPLMSREAREVEGLRFPFPFAFAIRFGIPPELDSARLDRVEIQSELPQSFSHALAETICIRFPLEPENDVIRIADDDHVASRMFPAPDVHPEIEHIMMIDIRKERRDHRSLRSACLRVRPFAFLEHPGLEPFLDQTQDAAVGDAMLDESDQPSLVEIIEEALYVRIEH